ncbi:MAG: quinone-dependent dihydroorotate dehydrogenase [Gammaproteobacteria bacterium]
MKAFIKIFRFFPPETAHHLALLSLKILNKVKVLKLFFPTNKDFDNPKEYFNLKFKNMLGVAAGLDKNGDYVEELESLGFGFIELGTVTPKPQEGNQKPRVFRYINQRAVVNRLGFNNKGVDYLVSQIKNKKYDALIGVNIGANKESKNDQRVEDYVYCFEKVHKYCDYVTVNISSPNTPELRKLHNPDELEKIFKRINEIKSINQTDIPILLKISPDENQETILNILKIHETLKINGLIVSNTSIDKSILEDCSHEGGISGKPLFEKSNQLIERVHEFDNEIFIIGVGGVFSKEDYESKIKSGASLVQIYTGFIFEGPAIVKNILSK